MDPVLGAVLAVCGALAGVFVGYLYRRISSNALSQLVQKRREEALAKQGFGYHHRVQGVQMAAFESSYSRLPQNDNH